MLVSVALAVECFGYFLKRAVAFPVFRHFSWHFSFRLLEFNSFKYCSSTRQCFYKKGSIGQGCVLSVDLSENCVYLHAGNAKPFELKRALASRDMT